MKKNVCGIPAAKVEGAVGAIGAAIQEDHAALSAAGKADAARRSLSQAGAEKQAAFCESGTLAL